jgi:adenosylmethionine-8-amino-7-oxononanoate aminotransferase
MSWQQWDRDHVWHPYATAINPAPMVPVVAASGVHLTLDDGRQLLDGMSSWWSAMHGYNHPDMNAAVLAQLQKMAHVMFGGITHPQAAQLCKTLSDLLPEPLNRVFLSDSGSVSVEVALKMALQYWHSRGEGGKNRMLTVRNGYHGDTFAAMSVCDPVTGMHHLFSETLTKQFFAPAPRSPFHGDFDDTEMAGIAEQLEKHHQQIAAVILEPVVQGTGGMNFYHPDYLKALRELCDRHQVLLIFDEIATGFGRTGKLFALEHANVVPDIVCLGKTLTGGYLSLAATICSDHIAETISSGEAGVFMHGPTFMGNPLACAAANASISLLQQNDWQHQVSALESGMQQHLMTAASLPGIADVRVLGGIGVIETSEAVDMTILQPMLVEAGIWVRPFGKLVYIMPPYIMQAEQLAQLCTRLVEVVRAYLARRQ